MVFFTENIFNKIDKNHTRRLCRSIQGILNAILLVLNKQGIVITENQQKILLQVTDIQRLTQILNDSLSGTLSIDQLIQDLSPKSK